MLDIVASCETLGNAVFWDVPYYIVDNEESLEFFILWEQAVKVEFIGEKFLSSELPTPVLSTKYNEVYKGNRDVLGPISFNTGGGYRHLVYFNVFGHSTSPEHIKKVNALMKDFLNRANTF